MTHEQKPESAEFRTREEQIETMTVHYMEAGFPINAARKLANDGVAEAEARGAAEQRRKDAEGAEPVAYRWLSQFPGCEHWLLEYGANVPGYKTKLRGITPLYT
ncbi:hypothetical protein, partial [Asaia astilbis]|uniref:hypothetical protein n=1 Tax=Asaia astilbis TaxID=610244 RepID=UPI000560AA7B